MAARLPSMRRSAARLLTALLTALPLTLPVALSPARASASSPDPARTEVTFQGGDGLTLHGTVLEPAGHHDALPGIVLIGGGGPGPREDYLPEAQAFARAGIATLVYDKRTTGYSTLHRDFGLLADDAAAGLEVLRSHPGVRPGAVGLWGFSEGGWVAPLVANRSTDAAFVITIGGPGLTPLRTQLWGLDTHLAHRGAPASLRRAVDGPFTRLLGAAGVFPEGEHDPLPALDHLRQPVLALWGEHDGIVPPKESAEIFRRELAGAGNEHATIGFVPGAGHTGRRTTDGVDGPGYLDAMTAWTSQVVEGRPPRSTTAEPPAQTVASRATNTGPWYESAPVQWAAGLLILVGFLGGALEQRGRVARWLCGLGTATVVGAPAYVAFVFATNAESTGVELLWRLLQATAVTVVALTATLAATAWRTRTAPPALLAAGALFVPWALSWRLVPA
ncbi:prolyl oligopeptidase family serine peptidase [Streptomyces sp. SP17BM10]|uniref:alpha/beta hydrolase family protein n=1 Tax=Streptomyces sp. SP17BM10 TaxID=3002530 RepID=UPI002E7A8956|nr:acyl-CoA thioester hydrolase/BAAT C-terminal domain-containing protein [Streptomyces sp. SP17BM10]MEE1784475.1 prolyl oligopeptidase family serine peptidase [Streptomyces sp. SP17BM10]